MNTLLRDLRIGLRVLIKEKGFCALAVTVLALGICGVTTMFSVVNGVMLRGFSFPTADRLVSALFIDPTTVTPQGANGIMGPLDYEELRPMQTSMEMVAAYLNGSTVNVTVSGQPKRYTGAYVTEDFLRILGVAPAKGRDLRAEDNRPGAEKVAIIGHGLWQRDFGGASDIVGTAIRINGKPATIVGVMPQGFAFPANEELWLPLFSEFPPRARNDPQTFNPSVIGLLKPGVSLDQANAEFTTLAKRFAEAYPETNKAFTAGQVQMLIENFTPRQLAGTLWTMLGFCVGVLLIACSNVMNMQFARATLRAKELAIRSSLGAGRLRLIRQMLTESLLLSTIGSIVGIGLAYLAINQLTRAVRSLENPPPAWITFDVDAIALVVTVGATVTAAVLSGLLPAWMSSRTNSSNVLRDSGRGNTSRRVNVISRGLVVLQIVVTCILLIGSLLQARSIIEQQNIDFGYDTSGVMSARMGLMDGDYPTPAARKQFYDRLLLQMRENPDFAAVAFSSRMRMMFPNAGPIEISGKTYQTNADRPLTNVEQVSAGYFDVTSQKLIAGRLFADEDLDQRQPVAVVNSAFAQKHFGSESPLGRQFRTSAPDGTRAGAWRTIVGVVTTIRMLGPFNNPNVDASGYYVPFYASAFGPTPPMPAVNQFTTVIARPRPGRSADTLGGVMQSAVLKADSNLPLYFVGTPKSHLDSFVAQNRIIANMFLIFGVVAIVLASVGIYGVMSFSVSQRRQEFGVRMALGANSRGILGLVLRQGALQVVIGLVLGVALAYTIAKVAGAQIQNSLFGVSPLDPVVYTAVVALIAVVSMAATFVPARRATRVDPNVALRAD